MTGVQLHVSFSHVCVLNLRNDRERLISRFRYFRLADGGIDFSPRARLTRRGGRVRSIRVFLARVT